MRWVVGGGVSVSCGRGGVERRRTSKKKTIVTSEHPVEFANLFQEVSVIHLFWVVILASKPFMLTLSFFRHFFLFPYFLHTGGWMPKIAS